MSNGLRRVGRGGAGNFVSESGSTTTQVEPHSDVCSPQPATNPPCAEGTPDTPAQTQNHAALAQDLEAQKLPAQPQPYARAGRGGAGNFHEPAGVDESREQVAERSGTAVASSGGRAGLTGRGGAGNWSDGAGVHKSDEARREEELADRVVRNVDAELAMPPKIYTPPLREDA